MLAPCAVLGAMGSSHITAIRRLLVLTVAVGAALVPSSVGSAATIRATSVVDVTSITGGRIVGPVTSWQSRNGPYNVEHLAGRSPAGDLLVFYWSPQRNWRLVNVSQKTGRKIAGPVTSWQTQSGGYTVEHLAGNSSSGDLLVFWWSPLHDWQAVNVSQKTGRRVVGTVTSWQARRGSSNAELLAGQSPAGDLLVFTWTPAEDWRAMNLLGSTGRGIAGPVTSWKTGAWIFTAEHLAARGATGDLLVFDSSLLGWRMTNVSEQTGRKIVGGVEHWVTGSGSARVEHLAGQSPTGDLLVFWRSTENRWRSVNATGTTGEKVSGTPNAYQVKDGDATVEVLGVRNPAGELLLHWWRSTRDWQSLNVSEITGRMVASDATAWVTPNGVEHLAAPNADGRLLVFWGLSRERSVTDALGRPFDALKRTGYRRSKVLTILWDPHRPGIERPSKSTVEATLFGGTNSVRGYFLENSNGAFTIENVGVLGWYDANYAPSAYWPGGGKVGRDSGSEAIRKAAASIDFAVYDTNRDRKVTPNELGVLFILPGTGAGGGLGRAPGPDYRPRTDCGPGNGLTVDGVEITCIAEISIGSPPAPGIVAHESSHLLLETEDFYYDKFTNPYEPETYSLMDWHGRSTHLDPFHKLKFGWLRPKIVFRSRRYSLPDVETSHRVWILMDPDHGPDEYFLIENRFPGTSYDSMLQDSGLAVWHVIEAPALYNAALPPPTVAMSDWQKMDGIRRAVRLIRPNLLRDDSRALWDNSGYDLLPVDPNSQHATLKWGDGKPSGFSLRSISAPSPTMQATITVP
jgi:M6 family metalloprotease-like protein